MGLASSAYGPFADAVGYVSAAAASLGALWVLWGRSWSRWRPPEEDLPLTAQRMVFIAAVVCMTALWLLAAPETAVLMLVISAALVILSIVAYVRYAGVVGEHTYTRSIAIHGNRELKIMVIAGDQLLPDAVTRWEQAKKLHGNVTMQGLLDGAGGDPDMLWSRESRRRNKTRLLRLFLIIVVSGMVGLAGIGFLIQVKMTGKPAAAAAR